MGTAAEAGCNRQLADAPVPNAALRTAFGRYRREVQAGAWRLRRAGWKFPEEASMFGFDNLPLSAQTQPALSTVDHRVEVVATAAATLLFRLVEAGSAERLPVVQIDPELIHRDSPAASGGIARTNVRLPVPHSSV